MLVMTQLADFSQSTNTLQFTLAQQVLVAVTDNDSDSNSEQKDKLDTFKIFRKFLVFGFTTL